MSAAASLISSEVDASYRIKVTCDFEADLSRTDVHTRIPLKRIPLAGEWTLEVRGSPDGAQVDVFHHVSDPGRFGATVMAKIKLFWLEGQPGATEEGLAYSGFVCFKPGESSIDTFTLYGERFTLAVKRRYRLVLDLAQGSLRVVAEGGEADLLASCLGDLTYQPTPHNFRLFFPKLGKDGASLWINADLLSATCPYFKDLLDSDFAEAVPRHSKRARRSGTIVVDDAHEPADKKDFDDSDDETDDFRFAKVPPKHEEPPDDLSFREIKVTQTAFSTYHALLTFLQTGCVRFAPLKSASKSLNPVGTEFRSDSIKKQHDHNPSLPLPVSPKSLYRLVDLLRIPNETNLPNLCLDTFKASLTVDGAAHELFGGASQDLEPIRRTVLAYVLDNWNEVSATASWKAYSDKVKAGELPGTEGIMMELFEAKEAEARKRYGRRGPFPF